jgi:hypothetical protein
MADISVVHVETWDVTKPAGSRDRSLGDDDIREFKRGEVERQAIDHLRYDDESGHADVGCHKKVTFAETQASDPTAYNNVGYLYIKTVDGHKELFWEDDQGKVIQITSGGKLMGLGTSPWRAGDLLLTSAATTPDGWSDVSATYEGKFIRISATALSSGGSDTHTHGGATGSHTLTSNEMPAHTHNVTYYSNEGDVGYPGATNGGSTATYATGSAGGGSGHTHTIASADNVPAYISTKMIQKS